jgi:hypothetical protein
MAREAAEVIRNGSGSVAVNCLSGRGRTGTFSAITLGEVKGANTMSQFVDLIVNMREHRDGLVETPEQFRFINKALGLSDTSKCSLNCIVSNHVNNYHNDLITNQTLSALSFFAGLIFSQILRLIFNKLYAHHNYKHKKNNF